MRYQQKTYQVFLFVEVVWECQWLLIDTKMSEQLYVLMKYGKIV